jgi:hypothetical protein
MPSKNPVTAITKSPAPGIDDFPAPARVLDLSLVAVATPTTQDGKTQPNERIISESQSEPQGTPDPGEDGSKDRDMNEEEAAKESRQKGDLLGYILTDADGMMDG